MDEKIFVAGLWYFVACCAGSLVLGPFPPVKIVPINSTVVFTCRVNTSALTQGTSVNAFDWNKAGTTMGIKGISNTLTFKVTEENLSGVTIWCGVFTKPISYILSSYNATLIVYGEYPNYIIIINIILIINL